MLNGKREDFYFVEKQLRNGEIRYKLVFNLSKKYDLIIVITEVSPSFKSYNSLQIKQEGKGNMAERYEVSYEEIEDILYVGRKAKVKFSVDIGLPSGDIIVDIGFDGLVTGIEIMNASDFFSLSKKEIAKISRGKLNLIYGPSYAGITINLEKQGSPIKNSVVIPYNKKIAISA